MRLGQQHRRAGSGLIEQDGDAHRQPVGHRPGEAGRAGRRDDDPFAGRGIGSGVGIAVRRFVRQVQLAQRQRAGDSTQR